MRRRPAIHPCKCPRRTPLIARGIATCVVAATLVAAVVPARWPRLANGFVPEPVLTGLCHNPPLCTTSKGALLPSFAYGFWESGPSDGWASPCIDMEASSIVSAVTENEGVSVFMLPGLVVGIMVLASCAHMFDVIEVSGRRSNNRPDIAGSATTTWRTLAILTAWVIDCWYTFTQAPGSLFGKDDQQLILDTVGLPFGIGDGTPVPPMFFSVFFFLGVWPAVYCATLLPGAYGQPVPAGPFTWSSFVLGAYSLTPYLALRAVRSERGPLPRASIDSVTATVLESKLFGRCLLAAALALAAYGLSNGQLGQLAPTEALVALQPVFESVAFAHASCLDFVVLWVLFPPVLLEDGRRRGMFIDWTHEERLLFALCSLLPCVGGALWLAVRPELDSD